MRARLHPVLLLFLVAALCAAVLAGLAWYRGRKLATLADLVRHLPENERAMLFLDLRPLRTTGWLSPLLNAAKITDEPEYKAFVVETGFDAERDLDAVLVAFHKDNTYFLVLGRFQWSRLQQYAVTQGGSCRNAFCQMQGSTPERMVSFFPLRRDLLALAVGRDPWAAFALMQRHSNASSLVPRGLVWMSSSADWLRERLQTPAATEVFSQALAGADRLLLWAELTTAGLEARLELACRSERDAAMLAAQLRAAAAMLQAGRSSGGSGHSTGGLAAVLSRGSFEHSGRRVFGRWEVEYATLVSLVGESL